MVDIGAFRCHRGPSGGRVAQECPKESLGRAVLLLALGFSRALGAQTPVELRESCPNCRVEWQRVVTLGDGRGGVFGAATSVVRDSRGRYLVASESRRAEVLVFAGDGTFNRTIGRAGAGPGEYGWASELVWAPGDSLHVIDVVLRRWTTLAPDFQVARIRPIPGDFLWDAVFLEGHGLVANLYVPTTGQASFPLHALDNLGAIARSFGAAKDGIVRRDLPSTTRRKLARGPNNGVWSARISEYSVSLWDTRGRQVKELRRGVPWFRPWVQVTTPSPEQPPSTEIVAIHGDKAGLLWVLIQVPDPRWRDHLEEFRTPEGKVYRPTDRDAVYDTYVEVINPATGEVLASQRLPMNLTEFVEDGLVFSSRHSNRDDVIQVWQLRLVQPDRQATQRRSK